MRKASCTRRLRDWRRTNLTGICGRTNGWMGQFQGRISGPSHRTHRGPPTATLPASVGTTTRNLRPARNGGQEEPVSEQEAGEANRPQPAQRGHQPDSENQRRRAGAESADCKHAGDDRQIGDDHSRSHADRHLPRLNERRRSLHVLCPDEPGELSGTGPAGRGVPQNRIGESERGERREVPEFVDPHRDGEGDCATGHVGQPPAGSEPSVRSQRGRGCVDWSCRVRRTVHVH